jgi:histidinol phosphatase-like enzyme
MQDTQLLMISRDDILAVMKSNKGDKVFRLLASLTRQGYHLLTTAPQPDKWVGDHGSPDDALLGPNSIRKKLSDAGGQLDGVYYVRRSMLTQKRNREDALRDILQRYATKPSHSVLLSSKRTFLKAAKHLGIQTVHLGHDHDLVKELSTLSKRAKQSIKKH